MDLDFINYDKLNNLSLEELKMIQKIFEPEPKKPNYYLGIEGVNFISRGNTSDPILEYKGFYFNYYDIEGALYNTYLGLIEENYISKNLDFETWLKNDPSELYSELDACIFGGYTYKSIEDLVASY